MQQSMSFRQTAMQGRVSMSTRARQSFRVSASAAVQTKTLKIGTRGSPLALAQAYLTRDLLKVGLFL